MNPHRQLELARSRWGRIRLHTLTMLRDRLWSWHLMGIMREFRPLGSRRRARSSRIDRIAA